ncbi:antibiotic biosynthesis monooxygenase family protein [Pseudonocardia sp. ICBG1142]|uniref:antibiotic biosynthesis monooxygenase family protein n=1 Tax=Pseudonocardia sp. ICBG1142 TaxID=2846760 RepID=UPI001CF6D672|nr:antibiotic biosynthesis monooxygenase family protein [Pseudonocardia sp. ICBG1142]
MLLVCRFRVSPSEESAFTARVARALELLAARPGFRGGEAGRAIEDAGQWVLTVRFDSVDAYRRALGPFEVREHVHPLLAEADTTTEATYESLVTVAPGAAPVHHPSLLS